MLPLGHPILLQGIWTGSLMEYAMSQTKILNRLLSELKCIVGAEDFDREKVPPCDSSGYMSNSPGCSHQRTPCSTCLLLERHEGPDPKHRSEPSQTGDG